MTWRALYSLDPWGERRDDLRSSHIVAAIANLFRPKGHQGYNADDFPILESIHPVEAKPKRSQMGPKSFMHFLNSLSSGTNG